MTLVTLAKGDDATARDRRKLLVARFFATRILPQSVALAQQIDAGSAPLMALTSDAF